jgi:formiminotetrahydrofolate cyclodeaminase
MAARRVVSGEQVDAWLEALASASVEPGGGAFAALSAASGSALVEAVARRTLRRNDAGSGRLQDIVAEVAGARPALLALADRDAEAFGATIDAYRMPHDDDDARTRRLIVLQEALEEAIDVQLDLARRSVYLLGLAEEVTRDGDPNAAADGLSAAAALHAATVAAVANAEINAFAIADVERRAELMATCRALRERAGTLLVEAQATFRSRIAVG